MMKFSESPMREWKGRYSRAGDWAVFHVRKGYLEIDWPEKGDSSAVSCPHVERLIEAVEKAKRKMGGTDARGGSFQINEFGQVIVPDQKENKGNRTRMLVGEIDGGIRFTCPQDSRRFFDMSGGDQYTTNCEWDLPCIGMQFRLRKDDQIYFWTKEKKEDGYPKDVPDRQDDALIQKIRSIKPQGSVRFIVNPWGVALTESQDAPRYIGEINYEKWFKKEM